MTYYLSSGTLNPTHSLTLPGPQLLSQAKSVAAAWLVQNYETYNIIIVINSNATAAALCYCATHSITVSTVRAFQSALLLTVISDFLWTL